MVLYNTTNLTQNDTGLYNMLATVDNWSGGGLGVFILVLSFIIVYLWIEQRQTPAESFFTASIVTFVFAVFLRATNIGNNWTMYTCLTLMVVAGVSYFFKTEPYG